jgi:hypothetical protein
LISSWICSAHGLCFIADCYHNVNGFILYINSSNFSLEKKNLLHNLIYSLTQLYITYNFVTFFSKKNCSFIFII